MDEAWGPMLRLAAERFSIAPQAFWRLSLAEWRALSGPIAPVFLRRAEFAALAAAFPDEKERP